MNNRSLLVLDKRITISGLTFYYKLVGDIKNPPLVFLHGHPMPHVPAVTIDFTNVLLEFAKYFYVIAPEQIGTMRSSPALKPITMKDRAKIVYKLLDKLEIQEAIVAGQSYGGRVATSFALAYPSKVIELILIDSTTTYQTIKYFWLLRLRFWIYKTVITLPLPLSIKRKLFYFSSYSKNLNLSEMRNYLTQVHPDDYDSVGLEYSDIKAPTLLIWGKSDRITPLKYAFKLKKDIPNSILILVDGGHTVLYEKPHVVIKEIMRNLNN